MSFLSFSLKEKKIVNIKEKKRHNIERERKIAKA